MKNIGLILISILFFSFSSDHYIHKYEKKISKEIKKLLGDDINIKELSLPDSLLFGSDNTFYMLKQNNLTIAYMNINKVNACRVGGCNRPNPFSVARYDHFYYMTVFNINHTIMKVVVLDYQSDHGYEICSKNWLKQFIGNKGKSFEYDKNVDAISGATVSVNGIIDDMNALIKYVQMLNESEYI